MEIVVKESPKVVHEPFFVLEQVFCRSKDLETTKETFKFKKNNLEDCKGFIFYLELMNTFCKHYWDYKCFSEYYENILEYNFFSFLSSRVNIDGILTKFRKELDIDEGELKAALKGDFNEALFKIWNEVRYKINPMKLNLEIPEEWNSDKKHCFLHTNLNYYDEDGQIHDVSIKFSEEEQKRLDYIKNLTKEDFKNFTRYEN